MKLAAFRYATSGQPDRILGLVDDEGEAVMMGLMPPAPHPENAKTAPHEYEPKEGGVMLESGTLCKHCDRPLRHQIHAEREVDEDDVDAEGVAGPIAVVVYDPVELYTMVVPAGSQLDPGARGLAVVTVPAVLPQHYVTVHLEQMLWDGLYDLEAPAGEEPDKIVADYYAYRKAQESVSAEPRGRRRVVAPPSN